MDDDELQALLSRALDKEYASTHSTLDAEIDVEQRLRNLYQEVGLPPSLAEPSRNTDGVLPQQR